MSASIANWNSSVIYRYGDTVFHLGAPFVLLGRDTADETFPPSEHTIGAAHPTKTLPWWTGDSNFPPPIPPIAATNFIQTGANWIRTTGPEVGNGTATMSWESNNDYDGISITFGDGQAWAITFDIDTNTALVQFLAVAPGYTTTATITLLNGTVGSITSTGPITIEALGNPPLATLALVDFEIDTEGFGIVNISWTSDDHPFNEAATYTGTAVGGGPLVAFTYDKAKKTGRFSGIQQQYNSTEWDTPTEFTVFIDGTNTVGTTQSTQLGPQGFVPGPVPLNAHNIAVVTFFVPAAGTSSGWAINSSGNPIIGNWNPVTGKILNGTTDITNTVVTSMLSYQLAGVSVIVSMGGANFDPVTALPDNTTANNLADSFCYAFMGYNCANPLNWIRFTNSVTTHTFNFNGLDLDIEGVSAVINGGNNPWVSFVNRYRQTADGDLLTLSPQAPYSSPLFPSANNGNGLWNPFPSATALPSTYVANLGIPVILDQNMIANFDFIFVQWYNQGAWYPNGANFNASLAQWAQMVMKAVPTTSRPNIPKLIMGFASADSENIWNGGRDGSAVTNALRLAAAPVTGVNQDITYWCAGGGLWNSPSAQPVFTSLYESVLDLPGSDIMMYCNANGVNPNWSDLPVLGGVPPSVFPPVSNITLTYVQGPQTPSVNDSYTGGYQITFNTTVPNPSGARFRIAYVSSNPTATTNTGADFLSVWNPSNVINPTTYFFRLGMGTMYNQQPTPQAVTFLVEVISQGDAGETLSAVATLTTPFANRGNDQAMGAGSPVALVAETALTTSTSIAFQVGMARIGDTYPASTAQFTGGAYLNGLWIPANRIIISHYTTTNNAWSYRTTVTGLRPNTTYEILPNTAAIPYIPGFGIVGSSALVMTTSA